MLCLFVMSLKLVTPSAADHPDVKYQCQLPSVYRTCNNFWLTRSSGDIRKLFPKFVPEHAIKAQGVWRYSSTHS
jgi:hypothetical protein